MIPKIISIQYSGYYQNYFNETYFNREEKEKLRVKRFFEERLKKISEIEGKGNLINFLV